MSKKKLGMQEIDSTVGDSEKRSLVKWFEKWGDRKWQYVLFHQGLIVWAWNIYWFFKEYDLPFFPLQFREILIVVYRELPILLGGMTFWTVMKIKNWNSHAFNVSILYMNGQFKVESNAGLNMILRYTNRRIQYVSNWRNRWANKKSLFLVLKTIEFFFLMVSYGIGALIWKNGGGWFSHLYPGPWPTYILISGIPLVLSIFFASLVWRERDTDSRLLLQNSK